MSTRCILMSIRKEFWKEIAAGRKVLEFRTRFPTDYRGQVYVYESGKKWRDEHKDIYNARMRAYRKRQKEQKQATNP